MDYDDYPAHHSLVNDWIHLIAAERLLRGRDFNTTERRIGISQAIGRDLQELAVEIINDENALMEAVDIGIIWEISCYVASDHKGQSEVGFWEERIERIYRRRNFAEALINGDMDTVSALILTGLPALKPRSKRDNSLSAIQEFNKTMASELADCVAITEGRPLPSRQLPPAPKRGRGRPKKQR